MKLFYIVGKDILTNYLITVENNQDIGRNYPDSV